MEPTQIKRPEEFAEAWGNRLGKDQVEISPNLFATIYSPVDGQRIGENYLYNKGFHYAWCFSSSNLALFLELNKLYGASDSTKVSVGVAEIAGFGGLETFSGAQLAVYTLPDFSQGGQMSEVLVPSSQTWLRILDELDCLVPLEVALELTCDYSMLGDYDAVDLYSKLSGLSRHILIKNGCCAPEDPSSEQDWSKFKIDPKDPKQSEYKKILQGLGKSPYAEESSKVSEVGFLTRQCFLRLAEMLSAMDPEKDLDSMVIAVRAALAQAQDASHLCTLSGVGYNTYPNPFISGSQQTIRQRYTGREFILRNRRLEDCPHYVSIELNADSKKERPYLKDGWC